MTSAVFTQHFGARVVLLKELKGAFLVHLSHDGWPWGQKLKGKAFKSSIYFRRMGRRRSNQQIQTSDLVINRPEMITGTPPSNLIFLLSVRANQCCREMLFSRAGFIFTDPNAEGIPPPIPAMTILTSCSKHQWISKAVIVSICMRMRRIRKLIPLSHWQMISPNTRCWY